ncbi:MAG TPA: hypothetical protein VM820_18625 [Vicinamibacterales bacterium]|nr:hypothetical protein [Vicinamibacterales bacterium]
MRHLAPLLARAALPALWIVASLAPPSFAQVAMPDAAQMSGIPLPAAELPVGTVSVRVVRERMGNNITGQSVSATSGGQTKTATTDGQGRAEFSGYAPGATVVATATVDGEVLLSQELTIPSRGGLRVALVAGATAAAAKARAAAEAAAKEPPRQGVVVIGGDSRIIFEFQSDVLTVFYILEIVNNARTPIDTGAPLDFALPAGAANPSLMEGSTTQATVRGEVVRLTGPFAPGVTSVQIGFSLPDHPSHVTLRQRWPAAFERPFVAVEKIGDMRLQSAQLNNVENFNAEGGKVFLLGNGGRLAAGAELAVDITNLPAHDIRPRWAAVGLAALIVLAGLYVAFSPSGKSEQVLLQDERARLMRDLVVIEERRRAGKAKPKDAERRAALMAELERVMASLDEAPGGGQGAAA